MKSWRFALLLVLVTSCAAGFTYVATGKIVDNTDANVRQDRTDRVLAQTVRGLASLQRHVAESSERIDTEIAMSRINSVAQTCAQFNDVQSVLADLVRVALAVPNRPDIPLADQARFRRRFETGLRNLALNDCKAQRRKLERALARGDFSAVVPYSPNP